MSWQLAMSQCSQYWQRMHLVLRPRMDQCMSLRMASTHQTSICPPPIHMHRWEGSSIPLSCTVHASTLTCHRSQIMGYCGCSNGSSLPSCASALHWMLERAISTLIHALAKAHQQHSLACTLQCCNGYKCCMPKWINSKGPVNSQIP